MIEIRDLTEDLIEGLSMAFGSGYSGVSQSCPDIVGVSHREAMQKLSQSGVSWEKVRVNDQGFVSHAHLSVADRSVASISCRSEVKGLLSYLRQNGYCEQWSTHGLLSRLKSFIAGKVFVKLHANSVLVLESCNCVISLRQASNSSLD